MNATSRSFTTQMPDRPVSGAWETRWDSSGNAWTNAGYIDLVHDDFVFTLTGSHRDAGDISIPGRARTPSYEQKFTPLVNNPTLGTTEPIENP